MGESIDFIKDRRVKTISAAKDVSANWTWQEKTVAELEAQLDAIIGDATATPPVVGQEQVVSASEQVMLQKRGTWDTKLDQLHRWTVQGVGMAKTKFRADAAKLEQLAPLTARGTSRAETLAEALAWESAWASVDAAWAPMPANTLAAFKTLRNDCSEGLRTAYSDARSVWRGDAEKLSDMARELENVNEAWYADATRAFAVASPEGDMIRGTVPTTYSPPPPPPVTPPGPPPGQ